MTEADDIEAMAKAMLECGGIYKEWDEANKYVRGCFIESARSSMNTLKSRGWQRVDAGSVVVPKIITASQVDALDIDTHMTVYNEVSHGNYETMLGFVPDKDIADFYNTMTAMLKGV